MITVHMVEKIKYFAWYDTDQPLFK